MVKENKGPIKAEQPDVLKLVVMYSIKIMFHVHLIFMLSGLLCPLVSDTGALALLDILKNEFEVCVNMDYDQPLYYLRE